MRTFLSSRPTASLLLLLALVGSAVTLAARSDTAQCQQKCNGLYSVCTGGCAAELDSCLAECAEDADPVDCQQACRAVDQACKSSCGDSKNECKNACPRGKEESPTDPLP